VGRPMRSLYCPDTDALYHHGVSPPGRATVLGKEGQLLICRTGRLTSG
jgi:hypothetical protein